MLESHKDVVPPQSNDEAIVQIDFFRFLREVLLTSELESIIHGFKEQQSNKAPDITTQARKEIGSILRDMLAPAMKEWIDASKSTAAKIDEITAFIQRSNGDKLDAASQIEGPLKDRFLGVFPAEKKAIARRLSQKYLSNETRCFLQASTTILHLAEELRNNGLGRNSLFCTNSTIFPYLMLGRDSAYKVYTLNGKQHDPLCCGWLYESSDTEAKEYLIELFRRKKDKLQMAIITPQYITRKGELLFAREHTANLVQTLCDEANRLVILSPGERLKNDIQQAPQANNIWYSAEIVSQPGGTPKTVDLIVSGLTPDLTNGISDMVGLIKPGSGNLHYQAEPSKRWDVIV